MIKVMNLCKSYGTQVIFDDISFNVNPKEKIGLVGRNGHGKTTLFRLILGLEEPSAGEISIPRNYVIGYLDQHIHFTQNTVIEEACLGLAPEQRDERWKVEKVLSGLGFSMTDMERRPEEFSGGFQVRINLAKVLVREPNLLLLDEPTNYLDILSIRWLIKYLRAWKGELILITHDRGFMDSVTTHTMGIHRKKIRKISGGTEKLYNQIFLEEEIYEKTRINDEKRRKEIETFINRFRAKARLAGMVQSRLKTLQKREKIKQLEKLKTLDFAFMNAPFEAKVLMEVKDLSFSYRGTPPLLIDNFNLIIGKNDRIAIIGKNGKGKSTLLKLLAGELAPLAGTVKKHPLVKIGYFGQTNVERLNPLRTVEEEIMAADPRCSREKARNICGAMMFEGDEAQKKIAVLSGGEKSRVLLGKLLADQLNLLLLDEPTNHLDMESSDSLLAAIDSFEGAAVFVTHNEMFLHTLANRLIVFDKGKILLYEGGYQSFLDEIGWENDEIQSEPGQTVSQSREGFKDSVNRKALKKEKAEILQKRSEVLRPLEVEMEKIEQAILQLEKELTTNNELLITASHEGDAKTIAELARKNPEIQAGIDELYERLDEVTRRYEAQTRYFAESLSKFDEQ